MKASNVYWLAMNAMYIVGCWFWHICSFFYRISDALQTYALRGMRQHIDGKHYK